MSDLYNWKVAVDECHQKHIGPPPALQRRIAYLEAHSILTPATPPVSRRVRLTRFLRRLSPFVAQGYLSCACRWLVVPFV